MVIKMGGNLGVLLGVMHARPCGLLDRKERLKHMLNRQGKGEAVKDKVDEFIKSRNKLLKKRK